MSYELPIERGKIREFARAVQSRSADHLGAEAVIPPTYLTMARMAWEPEDQSPMAALDLDLRRILHGEEEYVFHGPPPRAGAQLEVSTRLDSQWEKEGKRGGAMKFALIINEFRDESGTLVAEQRTTLVQTAQPPKEA